MAQDSRLLELKSALKTKVDAMDAATAAIKIEDNGGVSVSPELRDDFRKNLADAQEIKAAIADLEQLHEVKGFLNAPAGRSVAIAAGAGGDVGGGGGVYEAKTLGEMFTESEEFKSLRESGGANMTTPWAYEGRDMAGLVGGRKDVFTASAPAQTTRGFGRTQFDPMVPMQFRTQRVRDLFPVAGTDANLIDFFRVSGFTNNAAPVAERSAGVFGLKPQSSLAFQAAQAPVRTIAHWEAAHRNVLMDEPQLQATINNELLYGLRLAEDAQILNGTGTGEDLLGILRTPGVQAYAQAADPETKLDALRRASTRVILAYFDPTGYVVHPYDWEDMELTKTTQGQYVLATNIAIGGQKQVWRQPVVDTPAIDEGTFLNGAFGLGAQLYDRQEANIRIAEQHADFFLRNAVVILAEERLALATKRPESFVVGTFR